jgi:hypothetical protein
MIKLKNIKVSSFPIFLSLVFALVLVISSLYYVTSKQTNKNKIPVVSSTPTATRTPTPTPYIPKEDPEYTKGWETYTNSELGFSFKYPKDTQELLDDSEDAWRTRTKSTSFSSSEIFLRQNKYPAPTELLALTLVSKAVYKGRYGPFKLKPFSVRVFLNPEFLSVNDWYSKYGYFPFSGPYQYTASERQPELAIAVDGKETQYYVMSDEGHSDKFIYIPKINHMFFLTSLEDTSSYTLENAKIADQILATFKFIK